MLGVQYLKAHLAQSSIYEGSPGPEAQRLTLPRGRWIPADRTAACQVGGSQRTGSPEDK